MKLQISNTVRSPRAQHITRISPLIAVFHTMSLGSVKALTWTSFPIDFWLYSVEIELSSELSPMLHSRTLPSVLADMSHFRLPCLRYFTHSRPLYTGSEISSSNWRPVVLDVCAVMLDTMRNESFRLSRSDRRRDGLRNSDECRGDGDDGGDAVWGILRADKVRVAGRGVDDGLLAAGFLRLNDEWGGIPKMIIRPSALPLMTVFVLGESCSWHTSAEWPCNNATQSLKKKKKNFNVRTRSTS